MLDIAVTLVAMCLCASPFIPRSHAGNLSETGVKVDQKVKQTALITKPLSGRFDYSRSGVSTGQVSWDVYSSAGEGFKLVVSTDGTPAMRDSAAGSVINDFSTSLSGWSVGGGDRRFGFSSTGDAAISSYESGTRYRGFQGAQGLEIARRRKGPIAVTRTTLKLRGEFTNPLPSNARPKVLVIGTAMLNL